MSDELTLFPLPPPAISPVKLAEPDGEQLGYFFATRNGNRVKHGITDDITRRRRQLQTGNPEVLVLTGAYPAYSRTLEDAVKKYFATLRAEGGDEWFEPWTVEFRITALGGGIPPAIYEQWAGARAERAQLLETRPGKSVQTRVSELMASGKLRELNEVDRCIAAAMQQLVNQSPFEAMQPLEVQVAQWWERRLSGAVPFDLARAELRPAFVDLSQMRLRER
jgi:hypothetical protein